MTTDWLILLNTSLSFILFMVLHFSVFRFIRQEEVLVWLLRAYIFGGILNLSFGLMLFKPLLGEPLLLSYIDYSVLTLVYILGVFGMVESSLRIRLLLEIYLKGKKGLNENTIRTNYNKMVIIGKRLERMTRSGDLKYENGKFRPGKKLSYFTLHDYFLFFIRKLYKVK